MMARATYTLFGFIIGACFPLCALMFARIAGGPLGTVDFVGYAAAAHAAQPIYYAVDTAPLVLAALAFVLGGVHDRASSAAGTLRREVRRQSAQLARVTQALEERKKYDAQRVQQAFYDPVTGLPNRALFANRTEHALLRTAGGKHDLAVLLLDLDDFKTINDMLGHADGDAVLREAAQRFAGVTRRGDTLARLAADEYALLIDPIAEVAQAVATAQQIIDVLAAPMTIGEKTVRIGVSVGIATGRTGATVETLLRDAGLAMNEAKARGKGCLRVYRDELHAALIDRVKLGGDLQRALAHDEFVLVYQPIVDLHTERVVGMEALVRWEHPSRGRLSPLTFIKLAEELNFIVPLGAWVLMTACRQVAVWHASRPGGEPLSITVNVSPLQLHHHRFVADLQAVLDATGLPPASLVLEITETGLVDFSAENVALFAAIKALGVRLAIDDFGTGYSSLSYLQHFPFDILKIDKTFVDGVAGAGTDAAFARTIIALGGMLNMRVLAEGIEHAAQRAVLKELGCRFGQGYLFARPLEAAAMAELLSAHPAPPITAPASPF